MWISGGLPNGVFAERRRRAGAALPRRRGHAVPFQWAVDTTKALAAAGVPVFIQPLAGAGHVPYGTYRSRFLEQSDYFFYFALDVAHAQGQPVAAARATDRLLARAARSGRLARSVPWNRRDGPADRGVGSGP